MQLYSLSYHYVISTFFFFHNGLILIINLHIARLSSLLKFVFLDDCGTIINPLLVEGQIHGALGHGLGGALLEEFVYDDDSGLLLTSSLMDYLLPTFTDLPEFETHLVVTPSPSSEGGFKGRGEAGCFPAAAVVANAVCDALAEYGIEVDQTPITPNRVWRLIEEAKANA